MSFACGVFIFIVLLDFGARICYNKKKRKEVAQ